MKITVLCVGRLKEKFYRDAAAEYIKRLGRYAKTDVVEVADEKTPDGASETLCTQIKNKEGERLLAKLSGYKGAYSIALAIDGKAMDSVAFAEKIEHIRLSGHNNIIFVIGGSLGLSSDVLSECDEKLSFSQMTFPHQLMRIILLEQIYRGFRILNNEPYHK